MALGMILQLFVLPFVVTFVFVVIRSRHGQWSSGLDGLVSLATLDFGVVVAYLLDKKWRNIFSPLWDDLGHVYLLLIALACIAIFALLIKFERRLHIYNLGNIIPPSHQVRFPFFYWFFSWVAVWSGVVISGALFFVR